MSTAPITPLGPDRREAKDLSRELAVALAREPGMPSWKAPGALSVAVRRYLRKAAETLGYRARWHYNHLRLSRA